MAKFQYGDRPQPQFFVPKGQYILGIEKGTEELSKKGNEQIKLECRIFTKQPDGKFAPGPMCFEYLTFDDKMLWKIDTFLKSVQKAPAKGVELEMNQAWIDSQLVSALGWADLTVEEYQGRSSNKIAAWLQVGLKTPNPYPLIGVPQTAAASDSI